MMLQVGLYSLPRAGDKMFYNQTHMEEEPTELTHLLD